MQNNFLVSLSFQATLSKNIDVYTNLYASRYTQKQDKFTIIVIIVNLIFYCLMVNI
jgi:hypothetical protein